MTGPNLLVFGLGYSAAAVARRVLSRSGRVVGTVRSAVRADAVRAPGIQPLLFPGEEPALEREIAAADAILISVPPAGGDDPVLARFENVIAAAARPAWIGYLSTIGVYGDRNGDWVDETTRPRPDNARSRARLRAETSWFELGRSTGKPVQVFRIAGIYGPGRSAFERLSEPGARQVIKPGQVFNRIHVDDIASVIEASLRRPRPGAVYNLADDEPAPPQDLLVFAAALLGRPPPPAVPLEEADLSPMARSFYAENKRVRSRLIREELGVRLLYPTYREGLRAIHAAAGTGQAG